MLDNFFFGYLSLKWRRLARVLSVIFYIIIASSFLLLGAIDMIYEEEMVVGILLSLPIVILFICTLSWVLKPFIIKD
tara:strand:+ start:4373 stop:4603 length:231 start_codon:yes stop_codon:yes gene_type:complete